MSEKDPSTDASDQIPDLSALNFGPAWARDKPKSKPRARQESSGRERGDRSPQGGGRRNNQQENRQGGGGRRPQTGGRDSRDQRGYRGNGGRDDRRDDRRGDRRDDRPPMAPAPEGIAGRIMPIEEGLDALAKDIAATGRTHSVFDIAWLVLGGLERFHVIFESEEQPMYRNKKDHSLWLYPKECMAHFWSRGIVDRYYEEEIIEVDPPKGNFQSVARCGLSGVLIGPPNHHAYQKTLLDIHREKFSNMALDRYKSRIVMEHSEEAVQEWIDSMKKHVRWRPKSVKVEEVEKAEEAVEAETPQDEPAPVSELPEVSEEIESVTLDEKVSHEEVSHEEAAVAPVIEETIVILDNHQEVEQHFLTHGFNEEFESGKVMSVLANVPAKMIDPSLFTLLKTTVTEERRYPGKLASILCRQLSGRHLAVFKWKKHLHCGPARPRNVSDKVVMAERPNAMFHWVIDNPSGNIDAMWKALLPQGVDDDTRHLWYHDLHWLINEGIVLLFSDGKLHAAKEIQKKKPGAQSKPKTKKAKKKRAKVETEKKAVEVALTEEVAPAELTEPVSEEKTEDPKLAETAPTEESEKEA